MDQVTPLLAVRSVDKRFVTGDSVVEAGRGLELDIAEGEIVGLVGESGSGKSTLASMLLGLLPCDRGEIRFRGRPLAWWLDGPRRLDYRAAVQPVFQDPVHALDSRKTVGWAIAEPLVIHRVGDAASRRGRVDELLRTVDLDPALASRFPRELSGGQAQRVSIARALALDPALLVCDEAVSALDASVQAQITNLFLEIQRDRGTAMLFISHSLATVRHLSDSMAVMYAGAIVERGPTETVCREPRHPYTRLLISSSPVADPDHVAATGSTAPREELPRAGCRFAPRCPLVIERCRREDPALAAVGAGHESACWRSGELAALPSGPSGVADRAADGG